VTLLERPCPCGSAHRLIADVQSRLDDVFASPDGLARALAAELARLGVPDPGVEVAVVDRLDRQATGKVRRFRPLEAAVSRPG
jgi:hypothetical protein